MNLLRITPHQGGGLPMSLILLALAGILIAIYINRSKPTKRKYYRPRKKQAEKIVINNFHRD